MCSPVSISGWWRSRLRHAEQRVDLGEYRAERSALAQRAEVFLRARLAQRPAGFGPHPFRDQVRQFAARGHVAHQRHRGGVDAKAACCEPGHEPRHAQHPQRILDEGIRNMAQHAVAQILRAAVGVDQAAFGVLGHRVDAEVAPRQIVLERDLRAGLAAEARIAVPALAFAPRQRVFLAGCGMQEHGEIATDLAKAAARASARGWRPRRPSPVRMAGCRACGRAPRRRPDRCAPGLPWPDKKAVYPIRRRCRSGFCRTVRPLWVRLQPNIVRMNADPQGHMSA